MLSSPPPKALESIRPLLDEVTKLAPAAVVHELTVALGAQLVAAIAGVKETRRVRAWESGEIPQRIEALRAALQATRAIVATSTAATARAWFLGCSTRLEYLSPLEVIRENSPQSCSQVVRAAVGFALQ